MQVLKPFLAALAIVSSLHCASDKIGPQPLFSGTSVVPHDKEYYKYEDSNVEIIYTEDNLPFAKHTASIEESLHDDYRDFYNWELDETLYVGLISSHNQIANGFSTQWPNNRQINYVGGTQLIDYFTTTSWLDTLIYHETAHNYQVNVKASPASQALHWVFGNGSFFLPVVFFIVPNVMENSFMLEGNAVLNESWHGNGGRLYSGRFKAETILQAKAGNIIPSEVYNSKVEFPYGNIVYIQGGFYNLYMAEKYGIKKLNSYFKIHSEDFIWPQYTDYSMKLATGVDFESSLNEFAKEYAQMPLVEAKGKHIASSQFFYSLGSDRDEIFFITNESGVREPELVVIDKKSADVKRAKESWLGGKVIKVDDDYYTQGSKNSSPSRIHQGLFCNQTFLKKGTASKMVQGYLSSGEEVYFDVPSSFSQAQLYVGKRFYAQVNSSVIIDKNDNLYYFVQNAKTRTLYKNRTALYSYEGFYGIVSDVDSKGAVYFVANSEFGSTLYKYESGEVTRVSEADNIVEARLINDNELFLACISEKDYYYVKNTPVTLKQTPFETRLFFEDRAYYAKNRTSDSSSPKVKELDLSDSYNALLDMHYSGSDLYFGLSEGGGVTGSLSINFSDPLTQNSANAFVSRDDSNITIAGVGYSNSLYLLKYTLSGYGVVDDYERANTRDSGVIASATLPFLQSGYYYGSFGSSYFQDYDTLKREPLTYSVNLSRGEMYGKSMYINYLNALQLYGVKEREDDIFGGVYTFKSDLPNEFYFGVGAKYSSTDSKLTSQEAHDETRGVKVTNIMDLDSLVDLSTIHMPSIKASAYAKSAGYAEVSLTKVLNYSQYYFTFPLSLQRESLYTKYRYYELESFSGTKYEMNEVTLGLTLSTVFLNSFAMPLSLEYMYNDGDSNIIDDKYKFRVLFGASF